MTETGDQGTVDTRSVRTSVRLTFRFDGSVVELIAHQRVRMIAPPAVGDVPVAGEQSGTWLELRDERDRIVFHRVLHDPFRTTIEHHSPEGRIELHTRPPEPVEFEVVVPDIPEAVVAVLLASPLERDRTGEPAEEIGRYELRDDAPQGKGGPR